MYKIIITLLLFSSFLFSHHVDEKNGKLRITYAEYWAPYSYKDKNGEMHGILIDLLDELLAKKMHLEIEHIGFPWNRAQALSEKGIYDAIITNPTEKRLLKFVSNKEPLISLEWRGFTTKNSQHYDELINMPNPLLKKDIIFCSVLGDKSTESLYNMYNINSHKSKNVERAARMLNSNRSGFFVNAKLTMLDTIHRLKLQDSIVMHKKIYKAVPFTLLISNASDYHKEILKGLDVIVKEMKESGEYQKLLDRLIANEFKKYQ